MGPKPIPLAERVWSKFDVGAPDDCWLWKGARYAEPDNYGFIYGGPQGPRWVSAHRAVWAIVNGPIPDGRDVLHHCDNPPCVNYLKHLFVGSRGDNNRDRDQKGRGKLRVGVPAEQALRQTVIFRADGNPHARLTWEKVDEIRSLHAVRAASYEELAARFGVSKPQIYNIVSGRQWVR